MSRACSALESMFGQILWSLNGDVFFTFRCLTVKLWVFLYISVTKAFKNVPVLTVRYSLLYEFYQTSYVQ